MKTVINIYNFLKHVRMIETIDKDDFMVANPMFAEYITGFKSLSRFRYVIELTIKNVKIEICMNLMKDFIDYDTHIYIVDCKIVCGELVERWLKENNMKFMDLTFEDLEILKFYKECCI